jgi:hypothetical protein
MFQRIATEEWHFWIKAGTSLFFFLVFVGIVVRAILMPKAKVRHMESLPLEDGTEHHGKKD